MHRRRTQRNTFRRETGIVIRAHHRSSSYYAGNQNKRYVIYISFLVWLCPIHYNNEQSNWLIAQQSAPIKIEPPIRSRNERNSLDSISSSSSFGDDSPKRRKNSSPTRNRDVVVDLRSGSDSPDLEIIPSKSTANTSKARSRSPQR